MEKGGCLQLLQAHSSGQEWSRAQLGHLRPAATGLERASVQLPETPNRQAPAAIQGPACPQRPGQTATPQTQNLFWQLTGASLQGLAEALAPRPESHSRPSPLLTSQMATEHRTRSQAAPGCPCQPPTREARLTKEGQEGVQGSPHQRRHIPGPQEGEGGRRHPPPATHPSFPRSFPAQQKLLRGQDTPPPSLGLVRRKRLPSRQSTASLRIQRKGRL